MYIIDLIIGWTVIGFFIKMGIDANRKRNIMIDQLEIIIRELQKKN